MVRKSAVLDEESGFTLIELLVVIIILGVLLAIAVPSYLSFKDRANKSAAQAAVRALVPSLESFNSDNGGTANDVDGNPSTSGYQGISLAILKSAYDQAIDANPSTTPYSFPSAFVPTGSAQVDYCVTATVGGWTGFKHGPAGVIAAKKGTGSGGFNVATCS
jgi:type IV pilus assembly protein PilA